MVKTVDIYYSHSFCVSGIREQFSWVVWFRLTCTVAKKLPARAATRLKLWLGLEDLQPTKTVYLQGCWQDACFLCMELL